MWIYYYSMFLVCFINRTLFIQSSQICTSENYPRIYPFLEQRWMDARRELNLPNQDIPTECHSNDKTCQHIRDRHTTMLNRFFNLYEYLLIFNINETVVAYGRIYKCANDGIITNLSRYAREISNSPHRRENILVKRKEVIKLQEVINTYEIDNFTQTLKTPRYEPLQLTPEFRNRNSNFKSFTFIRDPLTHFESGFAEVIWLNRDVYINSTSQIMDMLSNLLDYTNYYHPEKPLTYINHMFPMSSLFFNFDIDFTLHLDTFEDDWENVVVPTFNLPPNTYDKKSGFHASAINHPRFKNPKVRATDPHADLNFKKADAKNARFYLKLFQKTEYHGMRALCHLLLIDYVCFTEYTLPPACQYLNNTVDEGRHLLIA